MCRLSGNYGDFKVIPANSSYLITTESDKRLCRIRKDGAVELDPHVRELNQDQFSSFKFLLSIATSND